VGWGRSTYRTPVDLAFILFFERGHCLPLLRNIQQLFPDSEITTLFGEQLRLAGFGSVFIGLASRHKERPEANGNPARPVPSQAGLRADPIQHPGEDKRSRSGLPTRAEGGVFLRVGADGSPVTLLPSRPQPRGQFVLACLLEHAPQLHNALGVNDTSPNCRALSDIAKRYITAGGLKQSAPCVADRIAEGAHAKAWMAVAVSKTGDPNLVIW
jgi:hypothetical protein